MTPQPTPTLPEKLEYLEENGTLYDPATRHQVDAPEFPCDIRQRTVERDSEFASELVRRWNAHAELVEFVERFVGIRSPSVRWTKAETERSLSVLAVEARALLSRLGAKGGA